MHRAARIAAAAHGGQVVTSQVTWQLARPGLPGELSARDLGVHRLKDIEEPERIVQLVGPGLAGEFPPLKSLGALTSLPVPSAPLVGREDDLGRLRAASRSLWEDSAAIAREIGSDVRLAMALINLGWAEREAGNLDRAAQVLLESLAIDRKRGDIWGVVKNQQGLAMVSLRAGRVLEANDRLAATLDYVVSGNTDILIVSLELSACVVAELGDGLRAARLIGAAEAIRQTAGTPMAQRGGAFLERYLAPVRATIERGTWDAELAAGRALTREQAVALLRSPAPSHPPIPAT